MEDPYERKRELEREEMKHHHSKLQEKPFSNKVKPRETFSNIKEAYGEDREYPQRKYNDKRKPLMTHDVPFKPSNPPKKGYNGTIDKFPEYKEDPLKQAVRKKEENKDKDDRGKWRTTHKKKTVPTPSITTNYRNLKSEFPSVFRRL